MSPAAEPPLICLGVITSAHGIKGAVKVKSFTQNPDDLLSYGSLYTEDHRPISLHLIGHTHDLLIAQVDGIEDRTAADTLRQQKLYVPHDKLPQPQEGEYYHEDLKGLEVLTLDQQAVGQVIAVHDFGAGTLLEIKGSPKKTWMVPFSAQAVLDVDLKAKTLTVHKDFLIS